MSFQNSDDFDSESYVRVNVRLQQFWAKYPEGRIETNWSTFDNRLTVQAKLFRKQEDVSPASTGHAYLEDLTGEKVGEYTETVAVGRALALMGFSVEKSIASSEEMNKFAKRQESRRDAAPRESKIRRSETKEEKKPDSKPAATAAESAPKEPAKEVSSTPEVPKTLKPARIFKPLPRQAANEGASNG